MNILLSDVDYELFCNEVDRIFDQKPIPYKGKCTILPRPYEKGDDNVTHIKFRKCIYDLSHYQKLVNAIIFAKKHHHGERVSVNFLTNVAPAAGVKKTEIRGFVMALLKQKFKSKIVRLKTCTICHKPHNKVNCGKHYRSKKLVDTKIDYFVTL